MLPVFLPSTNHACATSAANITDLCSSGCSLHEDRLAEALTPEQYVAIRKHKCANTVKTQPITSPWRNNPLKEI